MADSRLFPKIGSLSNGDGEGHKKLIHAVKIHSPYFMSPNLSNVAEFFRSRILKDFIKFKIRIKKWLPCMCSRPPENV